MLRTLFAHSLFIPWTLFIIVTGVPLSFLNPDYLHSYSRIWGRFSLLLAGARLRVEHPERIPTDQPVIFMANHQSSIDILALFAGLPVQFRWLAKKELFRIPLFGLAMRRAGYIPLDRADGKKALRSIREAADKISAGTSVVIFPEGTRSPGTSLLPFKKGGFLLAQQAGVPIVPVAIIGSGAVMPKNRLRLFPGEVRLRFFPAIHTDQGLGRDALMSGVRAPIEAALAEASEAA